MFLIIPKHFNHIFHISEGYIKIILIKNIYRLKTIFVKTDDATPYGCSKSK